VPGELRGGFIHDGQEATVKCCGLAVAMPQGQQQGSSFVERATVNMGTVPVLTLILAASGMVGVGSIVGRSGRDGAEPP
jgi:hypothetical protein